MHLDVLQVEHQIVAANITIANWEDATRIINICLHVCNLCSNMKSACVQGVLLLHDQTATPLLLNSKVTKHILCLAVMTTGNTTSHYVLCTL